MNTHTELEQRYAQIQGKAGEASPADVWLALEGLWHQFGWYDPQNLTDAALQNDPTYQQAAMLIGVAGRTPHPIFGLVYLAPGKISPAPYIHLMRSRLRALPPKIGNLTQLRALYLNGNRLQFLARHIFNLHGLEQLNLAGNDLLEIPPYVGQLTNLRTLDLSYNQLDTLPLELGMLPQLEKLSVVEGNPLSAFPPEVVAAGDAGVLAFIREHV